MLAVKSPHKHHIQSNLSSTDSEGTEQSVRIREVSVREKATTMTSLLS